MNESEIRAFLTIALMAAVADGANGRYGGEIAERARTIDVRNLPALIKISL